MRPDPQRDWIGLGLSGGTSADGIDCALVRFPEGAAGVPLPELLAWQTVELGELERARLDRLATGDAQAIALAHQWLGTVFGMAGRRLMDEHPRWPPDFAGCGGQTVAHLGAKGTLQLGAAPAMMELLGVPVVSDFRTSDVAAGGQGAPLAPFLDWVLFRDSPGTVALNIGGIANLTWVARQPARVLAFDSGPGNSLIDRCARWAGVGAYDAGGALAATGTVDEALLGRLLAMPFFVQPPPRSTGLESFGDDCFAAIREREPELSAPDLAATLTAFTARSIADALRWLPEPPTRVIVTGGGAHNPVLISMLAEAIAPVAAAPYPAPGWTDAKEAVLWAMLAHERLRGRPANLPSATGARGPRLLGAVCRPH